MRKNMEYITDEELESLIREMEQSELVTAPPDLQNQILEVLEREMRTPEERKARDKVIEFKRYRFRVMTTVAAAVLVVFLLPRLENLQPQKTESVKPFMKNEFIIQGRYEKKEEVLNDSGMLETMLGNVNIFADNSRFNLFRE